MMKLLSLKKMLQLNSVFSICCAMPCLFFGTALAQAIGAIEPWMLHIVGATLIVWALDLLWVASRPLINPVLVKAIIIADFGWVLGTFILLVGFEAMFTAAGIVLLSVVALLVLTIAVLQVRALLGGDEGGVIQKVA